MSFKIPEIPLSEENFGDSRDHINNRRSFIKSTLAVNLVSLAVGVGLLHPARLYAEQRVIAKWPEQAFKFKKVEQAFLKSFLGTDKIKASSAIQVSVSKTPGDTLRLLVRVDSSLPEIDAISYW